VVSCHWFGGGGGVGVSCFAFVYGGGI